MLVDATLYKICLKKGNLKINAPAQGTYDRKPFRWTMVRDPIRRALSAYGQI